MKKAILLPDIHHPKHNKGLFACILKVIKYSEPDLIVLMGDQLNMDALCHWNENKRLHLEGKRIKSEYDNFERDILTPLARFNKKIIWLTGNHEHWAYKYIEKHPEMEGFIEPEICLKLEERGIEVVPYNEIYKLGKLAIIHGFYTNVYHTRKHVLAFEKSVCYGHVHTFQVHTKINLPDNKDFHSAISLPCLCDVNPDYMNGLPNAWVNGFGFVYTFDDGTFNLVSVVVSRGKFVFNGLVYDTNKIKKK